MIHFLLCFVYSYISVLLKVQEFYYHFLFFACLFGSFFFVSTEKFRNFNIEKEHSTERPATKQSAEKQIFETETQQICSQHYRAVVASSLYLCSTMFCDFPNKKKKRRSLWWRPWRLWRLPEDQETTNKAP